MVTPIESTLSQTGATGMQANECSGVRSSRNWHGEHRATCPVIHVDYLAGSHTCYCTLMLAMLMKVFVLEYLLGFWFGLLVRAFVIHNLSTSCLHEGAFVMVIS
jgi:hypothetical protein